MSEMTMTMQFMSDFGQTTHRTRSYLGESMKAAWGNAEKMADDLAAVGIRRDTRTFRRWMSGESGPTDAEGQIIRRMISEIFERQISDRKERIAKLRGTYVSS